MTDVFKLKVARGKDEGRKKKKEKSRRSEEGEVDFTYSVTKRRGLILKNDLRSENFNTVTGSYDLYD